MGTDKRTDSNPANRGPDYGRTRVTPVGTAAGRSLGRRCRALCSVRPQARLVR
jgi:hypothetical protein